jgi:hypothetical protein
MIDCCLCVVGPYFIVRLREMTSVFPPSSFVSASRRVWSILGWSSVESAFSFASR